MNCVLKCATLRTKNHVTYESNVSPYFAFAPKYEETFWTRHVSRHPAGRFFSHLEITLYKSLGTNYKTRNLIGKMRSFRTDRLITDTWFSREIAYFSVLFHGNVYFSLFSGSLGHSVVWLIISWRIIKRHFVVIRFSWILFFKFY